jgi:hypothetical protein
MVLIVLFPFLTLADSLSASLQSLLAVAEQLGQHVGLPEGDSSGQLHSRVKLLKANQAARNM